MSNSSYSPLQWFFHTSCFSLFTVKWEVEKIIFKHFGIRICELHRSILRYDQHKSHISYTKYNTGHLSITYQFLFILQHITRLLNPGGEGVLKSVCALCALFFVFDVTKYIAIILIWTYLIFEIGQDLVISMMIKNKISGAYN